MASVEIRTNTKGKKSYVGTASFIEKGNQKKRRKTFTTKKAALAWAVETEASLQGLVSLREMEQTFPEYFKQWIEIYKIPTLRGSTVTNYRAWSRAVDELFFDITMPNLNTKILQSKLIQYGKTHKLSTVKLFTSALRASLKDAHIDGIINKNLHSRLKPVSSISADREQDKHINAKDFEKLLSYLYSQESRFVQEPILLLALLGMETGARIGEIQALTTNDIDYENNLIIITKSYSPKIKKVTEPKNTSSIRDISITSRATNVLARYTKFLNQKELFPAYDNQAPNRALSIILEKLDIDRITFHGLRHSHVSYLLHNGIAIEYISKRAGHKDVSTTLKIYAHMLKEKEQAQNELALSILENI